MQISQVSNQTPIYSSQTKSAPAPKGTGAPQATDSVQLSAAAQAHIAGKDADHDGDSH